MLAKSESMNWHPISRDLLIARAEYLMRLDEGADVLLLRDAAEHFRDLQQQHAALAQRVQTPKLASAQEP